MTLIVVAKLILNDLALQGINNSLLENKFYTKNKDKRIETLFWTYMWGDIDVVGIAWVHIDDMEAHTGAIDNF